MLSLLAGWSTFVSVGAVLFAFLFSVGIGVGFGLYPARRAAGLNPFEVRCYE